MQYVNKSVCIHCLLAYRMEEGNGIVAYRERERETKHEFHAIIKLMETVNIIEKTPPGNYGKRYVSVLLV